MFTSAPYDSTDRPTWLAYADWVHEQQGDHWQKKWRQALRYAEALRRNPDPRRVLVGAIVNVFKITGSFPFFLPGEPVYPSGRGAVGLWRRAARPDDNPTSRDMTPEDWARFWPCLKDARWMTARGAVRHSWLGADGASDSLATPADFPGLASHHPHLLPMFFDHLARGLTVTLRQGEPWLRVSMGRGCSRTDRYPWA